MGLHTRLARIERELLDIAEGCGYRDINFTTEDVGRDHHKLVITATSFGDTQDSFIYKLTERRTFVTEVPTGYEVELLGQLSDEMYGKRVRQIVDNDIRVCARDLGNRAALRLFQEQYAYKEGA